MTHDRLGARLLALLVSLAMIAGQAAPVWAGSECPHRHAHSAQARAYQHGWSHHAHTTGQAIEASNPQEPCSDCDRHAGMTIDQCVVACLGVALPASGISIGLPRAAPTSFSIPQGLLPIGLTPECDPHPPRAV